MDLREFNRLGRRIDAAGWESISILPSNSGYSLVAVEGARVMRLTASTFTLLLGQLADACPPVADVCPACDGDGRARGIADGFACGRCLGRGEAHATEASAGYRECLMADCGAMNEASAVHCTTCGHEALAEVQK